MIEQVNGFITPMKGWDAVGKNDGKITGTENGTKSLLAETEIKDVKRLYLSVQGNTTDYDFYYGYTDQEMLPLVRGLDASLLSSVVNNGFTGTYIGMYTSSNHQPSTNYADFDWFNYQGE